MQETKKQKPIVCFGGQETSDTAPFASHYVAQTQETQVTHPSWPRGMEWAVGGDSETPDCWGRHRSEGSRQGVCAQLDAVRAAGCLPGGHRLLPHANEAVEGYPSAISCRNTQKEVTIRHKPCCRPHGSGNMELPSVQVIASVDRSVSATTTPLGPRVPTLPLMGRLQPG